MFETVKDKSVAAVEGTGHVVEKVVDTSAKVLTNTVKDTAKVGGAVGTAATGLVTEVVKDTKKVAVGAEHAAGAVVGGAVKATGQVGKAAVDTVHNVVNQPAHNDKPVVKKPELAAAKH